MQSVYYYEAVHHEYTPECQSVTKVPSYFPLIIKTRNILVLENKKS